MSLTPGTRLGSYEVVAGIGAGGMGEVYRARDHKLGRDVALKILPDAFAHDPDRLARFEREARTLASLNHPNIAAIYGIEESASGTRALVMELVPGRSLDEIIRAAGSGATLDFRETMAIARAIAEALEAAHDAGIVHRDLKPANVKVRDDGMVKVLDFGLAKSADAFGSNQAELATLTSPAVTQAGLILGTAAYMAPEQARGKPLDKRADVWAFGVVLYELLTARRLFDGETVSDVVAAVLTRPIDLAALPPDTPVRVRELVARCLERDPKRRLRDMGEARIVLESPDAAATAASRPIDTSAFVSPTTAQISPVTAPARRPIIPGWAAVVAAVVIAGGFVGSRQLNRAPVSTATAAAPFLLEIGPPPEGDFVVESNVGAVIISPDGTMVAFVAQTAGGNRLFVRNLVTGDTRAVSGTTDAGYPFWSRDSKKIGFFANSKLMTVALAGGLPEPVADAQNGRGGSWTENDEILFTPIGGGTVHRVSDRGGKVTKVTTLDVARGENAHYWPVALPGGRKFLYFVRSTIAENNGIYLGSLDGAAPVRVLSSLSSGLYSPPHADAPARLLWVRDSELLAQAFDAETGALSGDVIAVAKDVRVEESQRGTFASVSSAGTIVWASARAAAYQFAWYDRSGKRLDTVPVPPGKLVQPTISPDGRGLAYTRPFGGSADVMHLDFSSGLIRSVTSSADYDETPRWSPDSHDVVYNTQTKGEPVWQIMPLDGSRAPAVIRRRGEIDVSGFMPDGKALVVIYGEPTPNDIGIIQLANPGVVIPLVTDPSTESAAAVSPDGRWLSFASERNGRSEIILAPLTNDGGTPRVGPQRIQVSANGGVNAFWRKDGKELVYGSPDRQVMSVSLTPSGSTIIPGKPTPLFSAQTFVDIGGAGFAPTPDLQKFVMIEAPFAAGQRFKVLTGWK
jgi:eukaryotic-like serine/threonine-protein kinase